MSRKVSLSTSRLGVNATKVLIALGNILMLSEGRPGIDTVFELRDGEYVRVFVSNVVVCERRAMRACAELSAASRDHPARNTIHAI